MQFKTLIHEVQYTAFIQIPTQGFCCTQTFAERLFARLQKANERLETRLAMMAVISRAVGVHKLLLLNFYPFLQKYIQPHQRDVTRILAILIQVQRVRARVHVLTLLEFLRFLLQHIGCTC